jgi:hypothetical protein
MLEGSRIFLFAAAVSRLALAPTQPPIPWVPGALSPGIIKQPQSKADHSPPSIAEAKNAWRYEGVPTSFRTGRLERELQMVQLSATRCSCIAIL